MAQRVLRDLEAGPRDRESYFLAAWALLAEYGSTGVTVAALCERVGVTKGSFYHHFADMSGFVAAFAKRWQAWVEHLIDSYLAEPDLLRRCELTINSHILLVQGANCAVWAWSRTEPALAEAVRAVDARGVELGEAVFGELTDDPLVVEVIHRISTGALLGMQQRAAEVDPDRFVRVVAEWSRRMLHLDIEVVQVQGQTRARVLGRSLNPLPPVHPTLRPSASQDASARFDRAIAAIMSQLTPQAARGREAYFRTAHEILATKGSDALTVSALCERLGVTKGSFHHHFETMPAFVAAAAQHWEHTFGALLDNYATEPDPLHRLELMMQTAYALPHPTVVAWWTWGRTNPVVAAALRRLEDRTEHHLEAILTELLGDPIAADLLAEMGIGLAVGLQIQLQQPDSPFDAQTFLLTAVEWARRCLGLDAELVTVDGLPCLALHRAG